MISLIYGPKGTGKTKIILDQINDAAKKAKGNVVFIAKDTGYSVSIDFAVKCVYASEFGINSAEQLRGFVKGIIACNSDVEYLFIDGIARITNCELKELDTLFADLEDIANNNKLKLVLTISSTLENMPDFIAKYTR